MTANDDLIQSAKSGNLQGIKQSLKNKADINTVDMSADGRGNTALMWSIERSNSTWGGTLPEYIACIEFLIGYNGLLLEAQNTRGYTALMLATQHEIPLAVNLLLLLGASTRIRSSNTAKGTTALEIARSQVPGQFEEKHNQSHSLTFTGFTTIIALLEGAEHGNLPTPRKHQPPVPPKHSQNRSRSVGNINQDRILEGLERQFATSFPCSLSSVGATETPLRNTKIYPSDSDGFSLTTRSSGSTTKSNSFEEFPAGASSAHASSSSAEPGPSDNDTSSWQRFRRSFGKKSKVK